MFILKFTSTKILLVVKDKRSFFSIHLSHYNIQHIQLAHNSEKNKLV